MQRCHGCMKEYGKEFDVCPHCGYIVGTLPQNKSHLRGGTELCGRYMVGKVLGYGGFGITYIAWDQKLKRTVAIKEFFPNSLSTRSEGESSVSCYDSKALRFFNDGIKKMLDEGSRLSKFSGNENIVNVYDCFEENNTAYIVMEYLEGKDLKQYLAENGGKLSPEKAVEIILPVLNALEDMHKEKIIHRDIAPDNIFLCGNGKIKLLDFGSARLAVEDSEKSLSVMVKRGYAPKEQYASRSKQGPWTDVYAVCATLYKMITGSLPSESMERDIAPLESFAKFGINGFDELEKVIFKGLEPEISDRIRSVSELGKLLSASVSSKKEPEEAAIPEEPDATIETCEEDDDEDDEITEIPKWLKVIKAFTWIIAAASFFIILAFAILIFSSLSDNSKNTKESSRIIEVQDFMAMNYYEDIAVNEEIKQQYDFVVTEIKNENARQGTVVEQVPESGLQVSVSSDEKITVEITITTGELVQVPDVVGFSQETAEKTLQREGFEVVVQTEPSYKNIGYVLRSSPEAKTKIGYGSKVTIVVASDHQFVEVPDCVGWDIEIAKVLLESKGLTVSEVKEVNSNEHIGQVIEQTPEAKQKVLPYSEVVLTVSNGIPEESEAEIEFSLPSSDDRGTISIYIDNNLYETKTVLFDGSKYTAKIVGSGEEADVKIVIDNKIYFTCTVDFTKSPPTVSNAKYPSNSPANAKIPDVTNMKREKALNLLVEAGFSIENIKVVEESTDDPFMDGVVISQTPQPSANSLLPGIINYYPINQEITLTVGKY